MAKDERVETGERKAGRKQGRKKARRQGRRKDRQATKAKRVGALDKMAQSRSGERRQAPPEVQARLDSMQGRAIGTQGGPGGRPGMDGGPVVQPQPAIAPQPVEGQGTRLAAPPLPQPAIQPQPAIAPQPAVEPAMAPQPAALPPVAQDIDPLTGEAVNYGVGGEQGIDPVTGQPIQTGAGIVGAPPEQGGMIEPQPVSIDPATGLPGAGINTGAPASDAEAQIQAQMGQAQASGNQFNLQPPQTAPPEQFYDNRLGQQGMQNPRDLERIRRKRLALLNPQAQQLRPQGRGLPQIRYSGGPAFEGAFQQPPMAGGRPQLAPGIQAPGVSAQAQGQLRQPQQRQPFRA